MTARRQAVAKHNCTRQAAVPACATAPAAQQRMSRSECGRSAAAEAATQPGAAGAPASEAQKKQRKRAAAKSVAMAFAAHSAGTQETTAPDHEVDPAEAADVAEVKVKKAKADGGSDVADKKVKRKRDAAAAEADAAPAPAAAVEKKKKKKAVVEEVVEEAGAEAAPAKKAKRTAKDSSPEDSEPQPPAAAKLAPITAATPTSELGLDRFPLSEPVKSMVRSLGIESLFPIQAMTLEPALAGIDVVGRARTGCGKTLAFVLPIVERILQEQKKGSTVGRAPKRLPVCIVLAPTRELAKQ
ncbi:DEAD-box ATP-dependent RNA helicase 7, partial [Tetrabaena socialis]